MFVFAPVFYVFLCFFVFVGVKSVVPGRAQVQGEIKERGRSCYARRPLSVSPILYIIYYRNVATLLYGAHILFAESYMFPLATHELTALYSVCVAGIMTLGILVVISIP